MVALLDSIFHIVIPWDPFPELIPWISTLYGNIFSQKYLENYDELNLIKFKHYKQITVEDSHLEQESTNQKK
jgi:hypothetical protein